jgi:hypothetical protein
VVAVVSRALLPALRVWARSKNRELDLLPRPTDAPQVHAPGADSDRVLIIGSGVAVGWGVTSHDLALPGHLARALSARTGRGVDVDIISESGLTIAGTRPRLEKLKLWRYEAVVLSLGIGDAMDATDRTSWRRDLTATIEFVLGNASRDTSVFIAGIQSLHSRCGQDSAFAGFAERHVRALNQLNEEICAQFDRAYFVPVTMDAVTWDEGAGAGAVYRLRAEELAAAMQEPFEAVRIDGVVTADPVSETAEEERQSAVDALGIVDTPAEVRFDRIVAMAREVYGTEVAIFSVIDNDREWHKSMVGTDIAELARSSSFCSHTIRDRGAMIIPDLRLDERFEHNPFVEGAPHLRFYAGFPVESPSGERIGALCVLDSVPRDSADIDEATLRELALRIQAELRH